MQNSDDILVESLIEDSAMHGWRIGLAKGGTENYLKGRDPFGNHYFFPIDGAGKQSVDHLLDSIEIKNTHLNTVVLKRSIAADDSSWRKDITKIAEEVLMKGGEKSHSADADRLDIIVRSFDYSQFPEDLIHKFFSAPERAVMYEYLRERYSNNDPLGVIKVAYLAGQPAGVMIQSQKADHTRIQWLFTLPEFRRRSVAATLIRASFREGRLLKVPVYIKALTKDLVYFLNLGFEVCEQIEYYRFRYVKPVDIPYLPTHARYNDVLKCKDDFELRTSYLHRLNLPLHVDPPKNWDSFAALDIILRHSGTNRKDKAILDAGGEVDSAILSQLHASGFSNLQCINLIITKEETFNSIQYSYGDITSTMFPSQTFDFVACLSVIEHGVDPYCYFKEMARILKPGGLLITSTDYWHAAIDTKGKVAYNSELNVFQPTEIIRLMELANECGLFLKEPLSLECGGKTVTWFGLEYTFIYFTLEKNRIS